MNVFLRLNTNVLNYFLIYVRMLITLNLLFESESYDSHVIVRAKARLFKKLHTEYYVRSSEYFPTISDVGCRRRNVLK